MDNTRTKRRREATPPVSEAYTRAARALNSLATAEAELHETGFVNSDVLDWAMNDISNAKRRCQLFMKEAKQ